MSSQFRQKVHQYRYHCSQLTKMGKKNRRQKIGKDEIAAAIRTLSTFNRMFTNAMESNSDLEKEEFVKKLLKNESKVLAAIPKVQPEAYDLSSVYYNLGLTNASLALIKPGACDKAISYYDEAKALDLSIDNESGLHRYERQKIQCYLLFDRFDEVVIVFKEAKSRLRDDFSSLSLFVLSIARELKGKGMHTHVWGVLHLVSDEIERYWDLKSQGYAYFNLATSSLSLNELQNAIMYHGKGLSLQQNTLVFFNAEALLSVLLGKLYKDCCEFYIAMDHFQHALAIYMKLKSEDSRQSVVDVYIAMGWVYLDYGFGQEQNALQVFGRALSRARRLSEAEGGPVWMASALRGTGITYYDLGEWDRAIAAFENSLVLVCDQALGHIYLGNTYLEKYLTLPLDVDPGERFMVLKFACDHVIEQYGELS
jgi:tetratricopeptide (TPR) repeat protein